MGGWWRRPLFLALLWPTLAVAYNHDARLSRKALLARATRAAGLASAAAASGPPSPAHAATPGIAGARAFAIGGGSGTVQQLTAARDADVARTLLRADVVLCGEHHDAALDHALALSLLEAMATFS